MISKFKGTCRTCGKPYPVGEEIHWSREDGGHHAACWESASLPFGRTEAERLAERLGFLDHEAAMKGDWFK
jgi:hypothetical protein